METATEITCPDCGVQQPHADECSSCGTSLVDLVEEVPTMKSKKTTTKAWPTPSSSETDSSPSSSDPKTAQPDGLENVVTSEPPENPTEPETVVASDENAAPTINLDSPLPEGTNETAEVRTAPEASAHQEEKQPELATAASSMAETAPEPEVILASEESTSPAADSQPIENPTDTVDVLNENASPTTNSDTSQSNAEKEAEGPIEPQDTSISQEDVQENSDLVSSEPLSTVDSSESGNSLETSNHEVQADQEPPTLVPLQEESSLSSNRIRHPLFWGTGRSLFGIFIVNTFLTLITLGIYSFWGRVKVREFLNSQTSFANARFAYHGTGKELFTGWLKAMLVFGLPYVFLSSLSYFWQGIPQYVSQGIAGLLLLCFIPIAVVGAHRYRMSRTSLRNIRFSFRGTVSAYMKIWLKGSVLTLLTLGIYYPFFENERRHYLVTHSQFGSHAFKYDGQGKGLVTIYAKAVGLYLLTVTMLGGLALTGINAYFSAPLMDMQTVMLASGALPFIALACMIAPWFYLQAARQRYFWNHTQFGNAQFLSAVTAWKLFELRLGHVFLLVSTLGLAWPWVQARNLQFFYYYTALKGPINFQRIEQDALDASPTGEELAGFFDTGFDLG